MNLWHEIIRLVSAGLNNKIMVLNHCKKVLHGMKCVHLWFETLRLFQIIWVNNLIPIWRLIFSFSDQKSRATATGGTVSGSGRHVKVAKTTWRSSK
jgi:hypothetical protein